MYEAITRTIRVRAEPHYIDERSSPDEGYFFWAYTIEITNLGEETVQLRSRFWRIVDGEGKSQEVRGVGVVGEQPIIAPGQTYRYTSGAPLKTPSGFMEGSYQMEDEGGKLFDVKIPAFSLDSPFAPRAVN